MENIQWLIDNGGSAIKMRMINERLIDKDKYDINKLAEELLKIEKAKNSLGYFDQFKDFRSIPNRELYGLVHNTYENCFEPFMTLLTEIGFRSGLSVLDEKIEIMRPVYSHLMEIYPFHGIIIMLKLLKAGYFFNDIEDYVIKRLNKIHKAAKIQIFDIYETDPSKIRQPNKWKDKLILKDEYNPYESETPLPLIYDIELVLYAYENIKDDAKQKVDDIMRYILEPDYQKTSGDYGWHWSEKEKTYHAGTPGCGLPFYNDSEFLELNSHQKYFFLTMLDKMAYSPVMLKSEWLQKCIDYLEQYKTERGTYNFPIEFIHPSNMTDFYSLYISNDVLSKIKRNGKKSFAFELYSTFFICMMKNRMELIK